MVAVSLAILLGSVSAVLQPPARTPPNPAVEKARGLLRGDMFQYLRKLGSEKKFEDLRAILKSDVPNSNLAALVLAKTLEPDQAVVFCASLELGGAAWRCAIGGLCNQPKDKVIGYIKQVATSEIPEVRAICYWACWREGWDDLVDLAKRDLTDKRPLNLAGQREIPTLGMKAKEYLDRVSPRKP